MNFEHYGKRLFRGSHCATVASEITQMPWQADSESPVSFGAVASRGVVYESRSHARRTSSGLLPQGRAACDGTGECRFVQSFRDAPHLQLRRDSYTIRFDYNGRCVAVRRPALCKSVYVWLSTNNSAGKRVSRVALFKNVGFVARGLNNRGPNFALKRVGNINLKSHERLSLFSVL